MSGCLEDLVGGVSEKYGDNSSSDSDEISLFFFGSFFFALERGELSRRFSFCGVRVLRFRSTRKFSRKEVVMIPLGAE